MSEPTLTNEEPVRIPGLDAKVTPLLGVGLGLTGLALGLRPRLAPLPLALTAVAALLYRDPRRETPHEPQTLFAAADGLLLQVDEVYDHRFLHTDCLRLVTTLSPFDVPIARSPTDGRVRYVQHVEGEYRSVDDPEAAECNTRLYIGIDTEWGPLMVTQIASPLARRITPHVQVGDHVPAGGRLSTARFGARIDLLVQRDTVDLTVEAGVSLVAGRTRIAQIVPL